MAIATRANRPVRLVIERDGKRIERQVVPASIDRFDTGAIGVLPVTHPQIAGSKGQPGRRPGCTRASSSSRRRARPCFAGT